MLKGQIPSEFGDVQMMAVTGWTWRELQETPAEVVEKMSIYLMVKNVKDSKGSLNFSD